MRRSFFYFTAFLGRDLVYYRWPELDRIREALFRGREAKEKIEVKNFGDFSFPLFGCFGNRLNVSGVLRHSEPVW